MTPLLQEGKRGEAYFAGVAELASIIAKNEGVTLESLSGVRIPQAARGKTRGMPWEVLAPILVIWGLLAFVGRRGRRYGGRWGGGPWIGGGGFGGWGGGGGGFGGFGGGMSGGGGSSGGY
jgi:uncharacterized protein